MDSLPPALKRHWPLAGIALLFGLYGWALVAPDGNVAVTGTDIANVDSDGRLVKVIGFFGELATA